MCTGPDDAQVLFKTGAVGLDQNLPVGPVTGPTLWVKILSSWQKSGASLKTPKRLQNAAGVVYPAVVSSQKRHHSWKLSLPAGKASLQNKGAG